MQQIWAPPAPENRLLNIHQHTTNYSSVPPVQFSFLNIITSIDPKGTLQYASCIQISASESVSQGMQPKTTEKSN